MALTSIWPIVAVAALLVVAIGAGLAWGLQRRDGARPTAGGVTSSSTCATPFSGSSTRSSRKSVSPSCSESSTVVAPAS